MCRRVFLMCVILLLWSILPARAQKAYVTDTFRITFRTGPSLENKIIAMLDSGQAVQVLESQGDWSRVRLLGKGDEAEEGWVLSRYLTPREPWEVRANKLVKENIQLKQKLDSLEVELQRAIQRERESSGQLQSSASALRKLRKEYETLKQGAASYLDLKNSYSEIQTRLKKIQKDFDVLNKDYERLKNSERTQWFISGASVLLCGLIIGLILGRKQKKRRSSYY